MIRLVLFLALMLPAAVQAGPWPREVGRTFLSLSGERNRAGSSYASAYAEYGLTSRTTLGMETKPTTRYLLVWLTELPPADGGYQGKIAEIAVRS